MPKTLTVGIFVPVYHRERKTIDAIRSLYDTQIGSQEYEIRLVVAIGINGAHLPLLTFLEDEARTQIVGRGHLYYTEKPIVNIGKPRLINRLVGAVNQLHPLDYVVSYDSDMVARDKSWLLQIVDIFERYDGERSIGALCPNQEGENCHVLDQDPFTCEFKSYHLVTRAGNEGVAGGVLVVPHKIWKTLDGYRAHRIYAADDGHFMLDCACQNLTVYVVDNVCVYHPKESNGGYIGWKKRAVSDALLPEEEQGYTF